MGLQDGVYTSCVLSYLLATLHSPRQCGYAMLSYSVLLSVGLRSSVCSKIRVCVMHFPVTDGPMPADVQSDELI